MKQNLTDKNHKNKPPLALKLVSTKIHNLDFKTIEQGSTNRNVSLGINLAHTFDYIPKEKLLSILMRIGISGEEAPFEIKLEYEGIFLLNRKATKSEVERYAKINCSAILFPYVREIIADITRRAGFVPLHLGSINFIEAFNKTKKEQSTQEKRSATTLEEIPNV